MLGTRAEDEQEVTESSRWPFEKCGPLLPSLSDVAFLDTNSREPPVRLYSSWHWGGYLIYRRWPSLAVFDDGRTDFYRPAFVEGGLRAWDASPNWADVLARHRVNAALLPIGSALSTVLRERRDWRRVYQDRIAVLFMKTDRDLKRSVETNSPAGRMPCEPTRPAACTPNDANAMR
jgi:hypothetical protein